MVVEAHGDLDRLPDRLQPGEVHDRLDIAVPERAVVASYGGDANNAATSSAAFSEVVKATK